MTEGVDQRSKPATNESEVRRFQQWEDKKFTWQSFRSFPAEFQIIAGLGFFLCAGCSLLTVVAILIAVHTSY